MKRVLVNGVAAAVIIGSPVAGYSILTGLGTSVVSASTTSTIGDGLVDGFTDWQVTPATQPATATPVRATATPVTAGAGKGAPGQAPKGGAAPAQAPKAGAAAPAQAPKGAAAPAQAPKAGGATQAAKGPAGGAAPAQTGGYAGVSPAAPSGGYAGVSPAALPRTGDLPIGGLALLGGSVLGAGFALRRFWRK
ncbi:MAG TPA: hypothetical protein VHL09_08550 [Dehalococcoidia bacterium]|nr:hypothetical protein [Dehalococcoidia bacterium]